MATLNGQAFLTGSPTSENGRPPNSFPPNSTRRIAHLDMDAFYASVELLRHPQLAGLPVVIGGGRREVDSALLDQYGGQLHLIPVNAFPLLKDYVGRGVITTATYPARAFGIGSAMGLMKAAKLCPHAILLPVDFPEYRKFSRQFKSIITEITPQMEDRGVDEVYVDLTDMPEAQTDGGRQVALRLQKAIHVGTGLTCSVGVAPNKLLAKMASEFNKPNGISVVLPEDLYLMIWPLSCRKINGIGPKAEERLKAMGVNTIGDLASVEVAHLVAAFGPKTGAWLNRAAYGIDNREVETESAPVTMSRETTFEKNLHAVQNKAELGAIFTKLCQQLSEDLKRKGYEGRTVSIKIRDDHFVTSTRNQSLAAPSNEANQIREAAGQALKRVSLKRPLRLLGVRIDGLTKEERNRIDKTSVFREARQASLF